MAGSNRARYGSFSKDAVSLTAEALIYSGFGVPAFALVKILSYFYFARDNTKTPFYISTFIVILNILISVSLFSKIGSFKFLCRSRVK